MANVVRDPKQHPDAIIPDLTKPDPLLTFKKDDIAFVYGSKWKQRYFKKVGDDYFPLPAQWDVTHKIWRAYFVREGTDWWVPHYPPDNMKRPTGPLCDGCHSVNYNVQTHAVTEWNVGCEKCHGPGSVHAAQARADQHRQSGAARFRQRQRHLHPVPLAGPAAEESDRRTLLRLARRLRDGQGPARTTGSSKITSSARRRSPTSPTAPPTRTACRATISCRARCTRHGVTCFSCHDVHGTANNADLLKPANVMCLECHGPGSPNGPRAATHRSAHASQERLEPATNAWRATCRRSSRPSPTSTSAPTRSASSRPPRASV